MDHGVDGPSEAGVRHFDTANAYNNEAELGAALREGDTGENVFVATKVSPTAGASARDAVAAAADRLKRAPDCVYVHSPLAPKEKRLETWAALNEARREGLCRTLGAANCGLRHLKELEVAGPAPALVQLELSPYLARPDILGAHYTVWQAHPDLARRYASQGFCLAAYGGGRTELGALEVADNLHFRTLDLPEGHVHQGDNFTPGGVTYSAAWTPWWVLLAASVVWTLGLGGAAAGLLIRRR